MGLFGLQAVPTGACVHFIDEVPIEEDLEALIEMPASTVDLLFNFLKQNGGTLSKRAREREFSALKEKEIEYISSIYADIFSKS